MKTERSEPGIEIETALGEVLGHVRREKDLPCRIVDDPAASRIVALRKRLRLNRQNFAERFGLDVRALQEWEQGRRVPDRAAQVLLTVIDRDPEAVVRALGQDVTGGSENRSPAAGLRRSVQRRPTPSRDRHGKTGIAKASMPDSEMSFSTEKSSTAYAGCNPDRAMEAALQHEASTQRLAIPTTGTMVSGVGGRVRDLVSSSA